MAYMDQVKKAKIKTALDMVMPDSWKYSLSVRHHSAIVLTIISAPMDLVALTGGHRNLHRTDSCDPTVRGVFDEIFSALHTDNFDKSDSQTDYFHVGHYVDLNIGRWNKPFVVTGSN